MKKIVVDGHNLIPNIRGLQLSDPEDENKLISILQEYCNRARCQAELFFDGAPHGFKTNQNHALVHVHWVRTGSIADDAIISYVRSQGKNARNLTVVSSDHRVQAEVHALDAVVLSSESFASIVQLTLSSTRTEKSGKEIESSPEEIEEWLQLFSKSKK